MPGLDLLGADVQPLLGARHGGRRGFPRPPVAGPAAASARAPVRPSGRPPSARHRQAVVLVELAAFLGRKVPVGVDARRVGDGVLVDLDVHAVFVGVRTGERDEALLGAEQAGLDGDPLRLVRRVGEVDVADLPELVAGRVDHGAVDELLGLHGPGHRVCSFPRWVRCETTVGRAGEHGNRRGVPVGDPGKWWFEASAPRARRAVFPQVGSGASGVTGRWATRRCGYSRDRRHSRRCHNVVARRRQGGEADDGKGNGHGSAVQHVRERGHRQVRQAPDRGVAPGRGVVPPEGDAGAGEDPREPDQRLRNVPRHAHEGRGGGAARRRSAWRWWQRGAKRWCSPRPSARPWR